MPGDVPTIPGPSVAPAELPPGYLNVHVTPEDMGAGAADGVSNAGRALESVALKQKQDQDEVAVLRADTALGEWQQSALYDPNEGLLAKQGKDAIDAAPGAMEDYDKRQEAIAETLTNDTQRNAFLRASASRRLEYNHVVSSHVTQASRQLDDETTQSSLALSKQNAATNFHDPALVNLELSRQKAAIVGYAKRNGKPAAWVQEQIAQNNGATHAAVVEEHIGVNDTAGAQAYLDVHKDEIASSDRVQLEGKLKVADNANQAQGIADSLVMDAKGAVRSREDINSDIQKNPDLAKNAHLRDEVRSRVDQFLSQKQQAEAESQKATFVQAARMVQDPNNHLGVFDPQVQQLRLGMSPEHWNMLESMTKREVPQADPVKVYKLKLALAYPETRDEAAHTDLTTLIDPRTPEFRELSTMQAEVLKGGGPKTDSFLTREQAIDRAYAVAGIQPKDKNTPQGIALSDALEQRVRANEITGKKMTGDDINALAKQMLVEDVVYKKGTIYGYNPVPAYQVAPEDRANVVMPFAKLAERNPQMAAQAETNLKSRAAVLGLTPERIPQDGYEQALGHVIMANDLKAAGDTEGAKREMQAMDDALRKAHKPLPAPGESAGGVRLVVPEIGGYN